MKASKKFQVMGLFCLKVTLVQPKTVARVSRGSFQQATASKVSNLMGLVFLKRTLVQQKTVAGVSSYATEVSWQVWGKTDSWFAIQPRKISANFTPRSQRVEISNLMILVFQKRTLVNQKTVE